NKRDIGMVFQFAVVYDTISVYENIILPLKAKKFQENEIKQRVIEIAELLNLNDYLDKRAKGLDIAVRQRIALARALVKQPRLLLLDEPLTPLDPISRVKLRTDLKRLQKEKNLTAIYVTHDQSEAITLADRVAVMNEGRLIQFDKPENIYLHPANTFVAKFIGEPGMNLIESSIVKYEGKIFLQIGNQTVFLDRFLDLEDKCDQIKDVILGIRPEHIKIRSIKGDLKGVITLVEIHGNRSLVHVDIGGVEIVVKHPTIFKDKSHEEVWLELQKDKIVLFDKENKANLNLRR
ncbi:MAG: ABC transporter ATP-binding protein, partial [Candidatus Bathyarchaeia archaeon]